MSQRARLTWSVVFILGLGLGRFQQRVFAVDKDTPQDAISEAEQYVRQALEFRLEGDSKYSQMLLRLALRESPDYAPAHWAKGEVQVDGNWISVADAQAHFKRDLVLKAQYDTQPVPVSSGPNSD